MSLKFRLFSIILIFFVAFLSVVYLVINYSKTEEDYMKPISRIDFSDTAYSSYIKDGFDEPEDEQRWSNKNYSIIDVPLTPHQEYIMDINVKAYPLEGKTQSIKLYFNEHFIEEKIIDTIKYRNYSFNIPAENIASSNHIKFEYSYTAPIQKNESKHDLAVSFKYLIFRETN